MDPPDMDPQVTGGSLQFKYFSIFLNFDHVSNLNAHRMEDAVGCTSLTIFELFTSRVSDSFQIRNFSKPDTEPGRVLKQLKRKRL
jgi:hypothetical protein